MARVGLDVEFQGGDKGQEEGEEKLECEEHVDVGRQVAVAFGLAKGMLAVCDRNRTRCCCCWWWAGDRKLSARKLELSTGALSASHVAP